MTVISSDSSNCPAIGRSSPPQLVQARSASSSVNTCGATGSSGPGLRPRRALLLRALFRALLLLGLGPGDRILRGLGLGLEHLDHLERQLQVAGLATEPLELTALLGQRLEQERVLRLERLRDPAQLLDVLLAREVDVEGHAFLLITSRGPKQEVSARSRPATAHACRRACNPR